MQKWAGISLLSVYSAYLAVHQFEVILLAILAVAGRQAFTGISDLRFEI
jgi:hypothetical protein